MNPPMNISQAGLDAIKRREGLRLIAYPDAGGFSIGYGHFGAKEGDTCAEEQASVWLMEDIKHCEDVINLRVEVPLTQNQFDALCSFAYNEGVGAFVGSTLLAKLNAGDYDGAVNEFAHWIYSQHRINESLVARRRDEMSQWNG